MWLTDSFFIIFSLVSDATASITTEFCGWMQKHWTCSKCKCDFLFNLQERMQHEVDCEADSENGVSSRKDEKNNKSINKNEYFCDICKISLKLSLVEILKHRKSHSRE